MYNIKPKNFLYDLEQIKTKSHLKILEETDSSIELYETESGIPSVASVDLVYCFDKIGPYVAFSTVTFARASRSVSYKIIDKIIDTANKRFENNFKNYRVDIFDNYCFKLGNIGYSSHVISSYINTNFLDNAELLVSYSEKENQDLFISGDFGSFSIFYSDEMKGLIYCFDRLIELTKNFKPTDLLLQELFESRKISFLNSGFTSSDECKFYSNENGLYIFYPYDFESLKQFNFFELVRGYQMFSVQFKNYAKSLNSTDCFCLMDISKQFIEKKETNKTDDNPHSPNENYFENILLGTKPSHFSGIKIHSDKIFSVFESQLKEGDIVSFYEDDELHYGKIISVLENNQLFIHHFSDIIRGRTINSNLVSKITDEFIRIEKGPYALLFNSNDNYIYGKLIEENSTHYRFHVPFEHSFIKNLSYYNFRSNVHYEQIPSETKSKFESLLNTDYIVTFAKTDFTDEKRNIFFSESESLVIQKILNKGLSNTSLFKSFFSLVNLYDFPFFSLNLLLHCNVELFGAEKTMENLFNELPSYALNKFDINNLTQRYLSNLKKLSVLI